MDTQLSLTDCKRICADFLEWSGGTKVSQAEDNDITVFTDYAWPTGIPKEAAAPFLVSHTRAYSVEEVVQQSVLTIEFTQDGDFRISMPGSETILAESISTIEDNIGGWCGHLKKHHEWANNLPSSSTDNRREASPQPSWKKASAGIPETKVDPQAKRDAKQAGDPYSEPAVLERLAKHKNPYIRGNVAFNPSSRPGILTALSQDNDEYVRSRVASNVYAPADVLSALASDRKENVRMCVAMNPSTAPSTLANLSRDLGESVRMGVSRNLSTHQTTLAALAIDPWPAVRSSVILNPNTPPEILATMANDLNENVRREVAEHENTSDYTLNQLAKDDDIEVSRGAKLMIAHRSHVSRLEEQSEEGLRDVGGRKV